MREQQQRCHNTRLAELRREDITDYRSGATANNPQPKAATDSFNNFHICVTDPNIEQLADRIASSGGRQRSKVSRINSTTNEYRLCYCEDPFGNIIEIYTHNYETLYGGMNLARISHAP